MERYHLINGVKVALTAEEEAKRDTFEAAERIEMAANKYKNDRQFNGTKTYPNVKEQLDQLFRDVDSGKFGADAKTGEWYIAIKEVKDTNPKPS